MKIATLSAEPSRVPSIPSKRVGLNNLGLAYLLGSAIVTPETLLCWHR